MILQKSRIEFNVTSDDLIPFYPINFTEISPNPIKQVIVGPQNKIMENFFVIGAVNGLK